MLGRTRADVLASPATTTRSSCSTASSRAARCPTRCASTASASGRAPRRPVSAVRHPHPHARRALRLAFGSCRVSVPHDKPYALQQGRRPARPRGRRAARARRADAQRARRRVARRAAAARRPGLRRRGLARRRRSSSTRAAGTAAPPPDEVGDFEEYTSLYRESWSDPALRWLLSTVSSAMIFDDHDVHDDWNISEAWIAQMRAKPWWEDRIVGAYMSYWIYQHLGNLSPARLLRRPDLLRRAGRRRRRERARARLRAHAPRARSRARAGASAATSAAPASSSSTRARAACSTRAAAQMLSDARVGLGRGPLHGRLRPPRHRHVAAGAARARAAPPRGVERGRLRRRVGRPRRARRARSCARASTSSTGRRSSDCFSRLAVLLEDVAAGRRGPAPATIVLLSGDVHHAYVAEAWFPGRERGEPRPAGDVLADPQPARQARAPRCCARRSRARWRPCARRLSRAAGVAPVADALDLRAGADVRQPDRAAGPLRARRVRCSSRRRSPQDWQAPRLHASLALGVVPKPA